MSQKRNQNDWANFSSVSFAFGFDFSIHSLCSDYIRWNNTYTAKISELSILSEPLTNILFHRCIGLRKKVTTLCLLSDKRLGLMWYLILTKWPGHTHIHTHTTHTFHIPCHHFELIFCSLHSLPCHDKASWAFIMLFLERENVYTFTHSHTLSELCSLFCAKW